MSEDRAREYAEWYVWAKRNVSSTPEICHAAAQAAMEAKRVGGDPQAAARTAATSRSGHGWAHPEEPAVRQFAEWYDWARIELGAGGDDLSRATTAAVEALRAGGDAAAAAAAARTALGVSAPAGGQVAQTPAATSAAPPPPPPAPIASSSIPPPPTPPASLTPPAPSPGWPPPPPPPPGWLPSYPPPPGGLPPPPTQPYAGTPYGYSQPFPPAISGPVLVPVWVAIVLGIGCGVSLLVAIVYIAVLTQPGNDQGVVIGSFVFAGLGLLMFACSVLAIIGIVRRSSWARVMSIIAGAAFCLSCVGIVVGLPVIIGSAMAKPSGQRG